MHCGKFRPLWVHTLVERHADGVHLVDRPVEVCLEVAVRSKRLFDMSDSAVLGVELDGLEVADIV